MKNLNLLVADKMSFCDVQKLVVAQVTQIRTRHSSVGKRTTQQDIVPFDLDDVARAYDGTLTSIVRYLEAESSD